MNLPRCAHPIPLPCGAQLRVTFRAALFPAWIERRSRRVFSIAGPIAFTAPILILPKWRHRRALIKLKQKLRRWGYTNLTLRSPRKKGPRP